MFLWQERCQTGCDVEQSAWPWTTIAQDRGKELRWVGLVCGCLGSRYLIDCKGKYWEDKIDWISELKVVCIQKFPGRLPIIFQMECVSSVHVFQILGSQQLPVRQGGKNRTATMSYGNAPKACDSAAKGPCVLWDWRVISWNVIDSTGSIH